MTIVGAWILGNAFSCQQIVSRTMLADMAEIVERDRARRTGRAQAKGTAPKPKKRRR